MRSRTFVSRRLLLAAIVVAGCGDSPVDLPPLPEVSRPRGATAAAFVLDLAGHGDVLAAGLDGGVALWDLSSGASRRVTRIDGLPSDHVPALALDERAEGLLAATRSGLARGWWEGPWASAFTSGSECDREFTACAARPGGGWVAGTTSGLLVAWTATRLDTLRLPRRSRIVALTHASHVLEPGHPVLHEPQSNSIAPGLLPGLVAATETEGLWVLRSSGVRVAWLQLGDCDGLPVGRIRAVVADGLGRVWAATDAGLARLGPGIAIRSWSGDSLLGRPARALSRAPDGRIYAALDDGVLCIDATNEITDDAPPVERVRGIPGNARALAWSDGALWWSDGIRVRSQAGMALELPGRIPVIICPVWLGQASSENSDRGVPAPPSREGVPSCSGPVRPRSTTLVARAGTLPFGPVRFPRYEAAGGGLASGSSRWLAP